MYKENWKQICHVGGLGELHATKEYLMEVIYENGVVGSNPTGGMDVCPL